MASGPLASPLDPVRRTAQAMRGQAAACRVHGSPLYAGLLEHAAEDLEAGGPTAEALAGHLEHPPADLLSLRLLGGVHALVLSRLAPELAMYYPSVGGTADAGPDSGLAWPSYRRVLSSHAAALRPWLDRAPQTNEIGRGVALVGALCHLVAAADLPVRLVEVGASAGLNLRADRFHITGAGASYGDPESPVRLLDAWRGTPPPTAAPRLILRTGGDLCPVDASTTDGRLVLTAYVWADQIQRLDRLRGGLRLAAAVPVDLRAEPASATLERIGLLGLLDGTWTVLWHSVVRQYLGETERDALRAAVRSIGEQATPDARFAHVWLEPAERAGEGTLEVAMTTWPGGWSLLLGNAPAHGIPTTWLEEPVQATDTVS